MSVKAIALQQFAVTDEILAAIECRETIADSTKMCKLLTAILNYMDLIILLDNSHPGKIRAVRLKGKTS